MLRTAEDIIGYFIQTHCPEKADPRDWNLSEIRTDALAYFGIDLNESGLDLEEMGVEELEEALNDAVKAKYDEKEERYGEDVMHTFERYILLREVDQAWKDHLLALDHLKEGIGLRGYGQRDPKQEYKKESYEIFQQMKEHIEDSVVKKLFLFEPVSAEQLAEQHRRRQAPPADMRFSAPFKSAQRQKPQTMVRKGEKVGRNDPCPCGSGKKYKKCCGSAARVAG